MSDDQELAAANITEAPVFELWSRRPDGVLTHPIAMGLSAEDVVAELTRQVETDGVYNLRNLGVVLGEQGRSATDVWVFRRDLDAVVELFVGRRGPRLERVSADRVVSELIRDQLDHNRPTTPAGQLAATAMQELLRQALGVIESLGFVIAEERDDRAGE